VIEQGQDLGPHQPQSVAVERQREVQRVLRFVAREGARSVDDRRPHERRQDVLVAVPPLQDHASPHVAT
jgi:hypothetical protein